MANLLKQSKLESHIEAGANIASGFIISLFVWQLLVGPMINVGLLRVPDPTDPTDPTTIIDGFIITGIFTITSYIRSYYWRRFFNAEIHKWVHRKVNRFLRK